MCVRVRRVGRKSEGEVSREDSLVERAGWGRTVGEAFGGSCMIEVLQYGLPILSFPVAVPRYICHETKREAMLEILAPSKQMPMAWRGRHKQLSLKCHAGDLVNGLMLLFGRCEQEGYAGKMCRVMGTKHLGELSARRGDRQLGKALPCITNSS